MTSQLLLALGFTAPFAYAAAVYGLFTFMERQASPQAKQTVSKWIEGAPHTEKQIANLAVYIFDRVYTQPLLGWRPIVRTAIMTLILAFIVVYTNYSLMFTIFAQVPEMRGQWVYHLCKNIVSDYCSLFVIRAFLASASNRPLLAMILGPVVGALAVIAVYMVLDITRFSFLISGTFKWTYPMENVITYWQSFQSRSANWNLTIPAFIVHLWLPLFAMSVLVARALNSLRLAARFAQWFLKDGKKAPFRSLGIIAALIVFVSVLAWRVVRG